MTTAIMQPYFFPYIGYFQLVTAADHFVVYDNIKYTKKGWINRNRILLNGTDVMLTLPLKHGADSLHIRDRELAPNFDRDGLLRQLMGAYRRAPYFDQAFPIIEQILKCDERNLFQFLHRSIVYLCDVLAIKTPITVSSTISIDHTLKSQQKVLAICKALQTDVYINSMGGMALYSKADFQLQGIQLRFLNSKPLSYSQFENDFVPKLSIIDVIMFNRLQEVQEWVHSNYELI